MMSNSDSTDSDSTDSDSTDSDSTDSVSDEQAVYDIVERAWKSITETINTIATIEDVTNHVHEQMAEFGRDIRAAKFANLRYQLGVTKSSIHRCIDQFPILESPQTETSNFVDLLPALSKLTDHSGLDRAMREYFDACLGDA